MTALDIPPWAEELLRESRVARLATADAKGQPLVVTICFAWDGARLCSVIDGKPKTTRRLRRLRNIEQNPQVSLVVDQYEDDWTALRHVIVRGRAEILDTGSEREEAIEQLCSKYPQYSAMDPADFGAVIRIEPMSVSVWSAS